jgi:DNA-entry nuclease
MKKLTALLTSLALSISLLFTACGSSAKSTAKKSAPAKNKAAVTQKAPAASSQTSFDLASIPPFSKKPYVVINNNIPSFPDKDRTTKSFESYSKLDSLGRCGPAYANVSLSTMPTEKRGPIGSVKPTGWQTVKYDGIDGKYLYNRCHLIGYQLTAENANPRNLITGTRYLNVTGMLPFENMVADYVKETHHHVLYRVTPIFKGNELVARGVQMEACSVEDKGAGIQFNVYVYNNQPGITIDYRTGKSKRSQ